MGDGLMRMACGDGTLFTTHVKYIYPKNSTTTANQIQYSTIYTARYEMERNMLTANELINFAIIA
jgi:hypothetical protein